MDARLPLCTEVFMLSDAIFALFVIGAAVVILWLTYRWGEV